MRAVSKDITKDLELVVSDEELNRSFEVRASKLEEFYQEMLALGVARKEDYNVISTGETSKISVSFLVR